MLALLLTAALLASPGEGAEPIPSFAPGPYAVGKWDWSFGDIEIPDPLGGPDFITVEHFGTLRYPAHADGVLVPGLGDRPRPFVVFAHGRFQTPAQVGKNHKQAKYLLDHLASWGLVVASVNLDVVGQFGFPTAIGQRGRLIVLTVEAFQDVELDGVLMDFQRLAFVGHSRGGEGCLAAWKKYEDKAAIKAIATIAPTDFRAFEVLDTAYLSIYGSKDGDVNNGWPIFIYDRVGGVTQKAFEYVHGANHFWFTDSISFAGEGAANITRKQHHDIARTYITSFLRTQLHPDGPRSFAHLSDGPMLFPVTDAIDIHPMYRAPGALVVDDFEDQPADESSNSLGEVSGGQMLVKLEEQDLDDKPKTLYHETNGLLIKYDASLGALPLFVEALPPGTDASGFSHVSLRVLQRHNADLNIPLQPQDFSVVLADDRMNLAALPLSDFGTIPWPVTHQGAFPKKSVLRTTRIPLRSFTDLNPHLDLTDLRFLALFFDREPTGNLHVDDLAFTN